MHAWPAEFAALLNARGRRLLQQPPALPQFRMDNGDTPYHGYRDIIDPKTASACLGLLEAGWPVMARHREENPLRRADQNDPALDYVSNPYNSRLNHMYCPATADDEFDADHRAFFVDSGLLDMVRSQTLRRFAECVTGYSLQQNRRSGALVICYGAHDYLTLHNDVKWPYQAGWVTEAEPIAYVDVHLVFSTDAVRQQYLLLQKGAFVNDMRGGKPRNGSVSVYRLPFWHCNTPLIPKPGRDADARRWLVMANFEIIGDNRPKFLS